MNYRHVKQLVLKSALGAVLFWSTQGVAVAEGQEVPGETAKSSARIVGDNDVRIADVEQEPDYTRQEAWKEGTKSGEGNFMGNCVPCHGPQGKGDGVLAGSLDVPPRDLTSKSILSTRTDQFLFGVIKNGGASVGLSESMSPWGTTFSDEEITNIVNYIRTEICKCKYPGDE